MSKTIFRKPRRRVERVFIHCSASDNPKHDNIATMRRWRLARGFSDIGYHFLMHKNGKISKGRNIEKTPAAQRGNNSGTIAICLHGLQKEKFTNSQFKAIKAICSDINNAYFKNVSFHGHKEVAAKACPVFDYKKVLNLDRFGSLGLDSTIVLGVENSSENEFQRINYGDQGDKVRELQKLLSIKADGDYGKKTLKAVKSFKRQHGLYNSGVITTEVWELLKKPVLENVRTDDSSKLPDLKTGSRGASVELLQELLFINVDGRFGENTARAVRNFKEKHGYYPSDLVQKHIWKLLFKVRRVPHYE